MRRRLALSRTSRSSTRIAASRVRLYGDAAARKSYLGAFASRRDAATTRCYAVERVATQRGVLQHSAGGCCDTASHAAAQRNRNALYGEAAVWQSYGSKQFFLTSSANGAPAYDTPRGNAAHHVAVWCTLQRSTIAVHVATTRATRRNL
jgi:hypothetical protein